MTGDTVTRLLKNIILAFGLGLIAMPAAGQDIVGRWLCFSRGAQFEPDQWAGAGIKTYDRDGRGTFDLNFEGVFDGTPMSLQMELSFIWSLQSGNRIVERGTDGRLKALFVNDEWATDAPFAQSLVDDLLAESQEGTYRFVSSGFMIMDWQEDWDSCVRQ